MTNLTTTATRPGAGPFSVECPNLLQHHVDHLRASGISDEVIRERGYESVLGKKRLADLGFSSAQRRTPGILIPLRSVDGKLVGYQFRPDNPRQNGKGKPIKYENPTGSGIRLDCSPRYQKMLGDPKIPLWITEGSKKADALASHGACAVSLTGVWGFKGKNVAGGITLLADWDYIALRDRTVYLAFDSDIVEKPQVKQALERLSQHLTNKQSKLLVIRLPNGSNGKVGVDDYLADGHTLNDLIALVTMEEIHKTESKTRGEKQPMYLAKFDRLVDIVDDAGDLAYLIREQNELRIVSSVEIDGHKYLPPPRDQLPYSIPRWNEVRRAYEEDDQKTLFGDLVKYHKEFSELPNDNYYILLATWDFSTYILKALAYSGYIYLYAVPERGKTKTGQAMTYVAYRGIHQANLREADLFRASEDLGATLFLDVLNLWKRAQREGSDDILLQRYEKGARIRRVLNPERGAFKDSRYYAVYGATIIASNEAISHILESRSFPVDMPYSPKNFPKPTPETGLPFRERLVAWRARNLEMQLPEPKEVTLGRLNDIGTPLWQIIRLVSPSHQSAFEELIQEFSEKRREEKAVSLEGEVIKALSELNSEVEDGKLAVSMITDKVNERRREHDKASSIYIGKVLRRLNFKLAGSHKDKRSYLYDTGLIQRLACEYGLADTSTPSDYPPQVSHPFPQIQKIVSRGTDGTDRTLTSTRSNVDDDTPASDNGRLETALGMPVEKAIELWQSEGAPVIHLGLGENCFDLEELLSWADIKPEHLEAVRAWLDKAIKRRGQS